MASDVPPPIVFDLSAADSARMRVDLFVAEGGRLFLPVLALGPLLQSGESLLRLYRSGWNDMRDCVLLVVELSLLAAIVASLWWPRWWQRYYLRSQVGTSVSFLDAGLEIARDDVSRARAKRFVAFSKIRSVRLTPDALFVMGAFRPVVIIPRAALPDDGTQLMTFFEERLVSKRLLRRSSFGGSTIVNTASP